MNTTASSPPTDRKRGSGVKLVYDMLRAEILSLTLPPGSPVDEVQLAERFGMSRTPIREALVRLAGVNMPYLSRYSLRATMQAPVDDDAGGDIRAKVDIEHVAAGSLDKQRLLGAEIIRNLTWKRVRACGNVRNRGA